MKPYPRTKIPQIVRVTLQRCKQVWFSPAMTSLYARDKRVNTALVLSASMLIAGCATTHQSSIADDDFYDANIKTIEIRYFQRAGHPLVQISRRFRHVETSMADGTSMKPIFGTR